MVLLVAALFVAEAFLSMWTNADYDMSIWFNTGAWMNQGTNIYMPNDHLGYLPLWAFWCQIAYCIYGVLGNNLELWRFFIKLPLILAQFGLAFAIYKFSQPRFSKSTAQKIFLLSLTWVFFIWIAAVWGQLNMLSALLTFLAFYAVLSKHNTAGALLLGVAVALKIYPLIILPIFLVFILKNQNGKEAIKFTFYAVALPLAFTLIVFGAYQWDINFLFCTLFYWTPTSGTLEQIQGGGMNFWSFTSLLHLDVAQVWILRYVWIPVVAFTAFYWFRKPSMKEEEFNLALISIFIVFMLSYSWVTEQSFLDPLPFIFLQIMAYQPKKGYLYGLVFMQALVFLFVIFNWGPFVFKPLIQQVAPNFLLSLEELNPKYLLIWEIRGVLGLVVSLGLCVYLVALLKPAAFKAITRFFKTRVFLRSTP